ncbi:regulatory protein GemA, partial [Marinomonas sp. S3726]|uniref:gp16 family protein n=1 Tax=Marinomonas sp. S3726 TaxID=579484 RepID=UPI0005FA5E75
MTKKRNPMAAIHAAKRDLRMDDDTYRAMLFNITNKRSAKDLNQGEIGKVLDHMRKLGATKLGKTKTSYPGKPHNFDKHEQMAKVEALLADLSLPWSYADAIAKRQIGVDKMAWVTEPRHFKSIIAALSVEQEKQQLLARLTDILKEQNMTVQSFEEKHSSR